MAVKSERTYELGDRIIFTPAKGSQREGSVRADRGTILLAHLDGDPFAVDIPKDQCVPCKVVRNMVSSKTSTQPRRSTRNMPTATEPRVSAKQLRLDAQGLGIEGYENMGRDELAEAIAAHGTNGNAEKPARRARKTAATRTAKSSTKASKRTRQAAAETSEDAPTPRKASRATKTPAKSTKRSAKAAPASEPTDPNVNPFRKGSNLHVIVPLLLKGGKRITLAKKLQEKVQLHHYSAGDDATSGPSDFDKRITLCASTLRDKHGWSMVQEGRGMSGWLQCVPPGAEVPDRPNARVSTKA